MKTLKPETIADKLGQLKAQIADLEKTETELKKQLLESGVEEAIGKLFRVSVATFEKATVDYKQLVADLEVPESKLKKYTTVKDQTRISVLAR